MNEISIKKNLWTLKEIAPQTLEFLKHKFDINYLSARIIANRNDDLNNIPDYLEPTIRNLMPNPFSLLDLKKGAERIYNAIKSNEKIVIFGDYDVDGATSSALISRYFKKINFNNHEIYIPDRIKEGYGPNIPAMQKFKNEGAKVIITVDCGTLSFEPLAEAKKLGLDVVVIDHHLSDVKLPEAYAVINPNRIDEVNNNCKNLAAVGVSFLFLAGLHNVLRSNAYFEQVKEPNLLSLLDLVALGTVCDVMTLTGLNRAFVSQGLKVIAKRINKGIAALCDIARLDKPATGFHLGFIIGPRINAGGRVGRCHLGAKILSTECENEAEEIAKELDLYNQERKTIETIVLEEAFKQLENINDNNSLFFAIGQNWHPGVIGIVCSRIKEKINKPTAVISFDSGYGKASARSVVGVDIGAKVVSAKNAGLLIAGGGHAMAAGFTVKEQKTDELFTFMADRILKVLPFNPGYNVKYYDSDITVSSINSELVSLIEIGEPYGNGNDEPIFKLKDFKIVKVDQLKNGTVRAIITDKNQPSAKPVKTMAFKAMENGIGEALLNFPNKITALVGKINENFFMNNYSIDFIIDDIILEN